MTLILNGTDNSATTPAVTGTDTDTGIYYPTSNQVAIATNGTQAMLVDASQNVTFAQAANLPNTFGFKNRIINGAMAIDQRKAGASVVVSNTDSYFGIDRYSVIDFSNAATWQQLTTSPPAGFQYFGCLRRNTGTSGASTLAITQVVESKNCFDLQSQSVTLSFYAKAGANFSAASSNITASVKTGTGTDQSATNFRNNTWTGLATVVTSTFAITTSWVKYTITGTVSASATQIGVQFQFDSTGTAGADDSLNVTGVQLEKGSTATSFDYRPIGTELALCERYCFVPASNSRYVGQCDATTRALMIYVFPQTMRTGPSATLASATSYTVTTATGGTVNSTAVSLGGGFINTAQLAITVASGLVAGNATIVTANGTTIFSAEL